MCCWKMAANLNSKTVGLTYYYNTSIFTHLISANATLVKTLLQCCNCPSEEVHVHQPLLLVLVVVSSNVNRDQLCCVGD